MILKIKVCLVILFVASFSKRSEAQTEADKFYIAKYKNDKICAISYTFDDGLKEHYTLVNPKFNKLGLKATFVINGSIINASKQKITDTTRMIWTELKEMAKSGHEISNHGWAHKNFGRFPLQEIKEDILKNDSAIFANIGIMPRTFAYPNNTKNAEGMKVASKNRVATRTFQRSIGGKATTDNLSTWVNELLANRDWGVAMTHGITYGYDHFKSPGILWQHLEKVKAQEDKIWVGTFKDVASYIKERDSTSLKIEQKSNGHYILTPTCNLDKNTFTSTLTGVVAQQNINSATVKQGKHKLKTIILDDRILFDFDPFGAAIDIKIK